MRFVCIILLFFVSALSVFAQSTQTAYLSGAGSDDTVAWEFFCTKGRKSGSWTMIPVPSNWELKGFGNYNYGHDQPKHDEVGKYRHRFTVPAEWKGRHIAIVFGGVMTDTEVFINGKAAGPVHQGGFYEFSYEITPLLKFGSENLLEVTVHKVSANPTVEDAERISDYWVFGGIYRPVWLEVKPAEHIRRIAVDAQADGNLKALVYPGNISAPGQVTVTVLGAEDSRLMQKSVTAPVIAGQDMVELTARLGDAVPRWTAETPVLCTVVVSLQRDNRVVHTVREKIGFRTVEVKPGDGIYINGRRVLLKGVNRHTFWPETGRTTNKTLSIADVQMMKDMNMNAVRMSHYPPDRHFLDVCDSLGLYVLDELAGWQVPPYDTAIGKKLVAETVIRDVNHPCVIFWDNGNEGGNNFDLDAEFGKYDPQNRTVLHPWARFGGLETDHYEPYDVVKRYLDEHVYMPTEFLHGLYDGGSGAGLEDNWTQIAESPRGGGMFLWVFADEGVVRTDKDGMIDVDGNHAPDGIVGPHREKEGSYFTIKEIWSPVQVQLPDLLESNRFSAVVRNRFDFTGLQQCRIDCRVVDFPSPLEGSTGFQEAGVGTVAGFTAAPQQNEEIMVTLPDDALTHDAMYLSAFAPDNRELWTWSSRLRTHGDICREIVNTRVDPVAMRESDASVIISTGSLELTFIRETGVLSQVRRNGREISFVNGPRIVGGKAHHPHLEHFQSADGYVVRVTFRSSNMELVEWRIRNDLWVEMQYKIYTLGPKEFLGITFDYPETKMRGMRWLGEGQYRVWKNRLKGTRLNVWSNTYKKNIPGASWDYPQFKGYYADLNWVVFETEDGPITIATDTPGLFLRVYTPERAGGDLDRFTAVPFPAGDISFLHAIPGIGTKFIQAPDLGPQAWPFQASGFYEGRLFFNFASGR